MRSKLALFALLSLPVVGWATGFGGGDAPTRIPVPARDLSATVTDQSGTEVKVRRVTFGGEIYVQGKLGQGDVSVPFEKIAEVRINPADDPIKRVAFVTLRSGESVSVTIDDDLALHGETTFGLYRIEAADVRKVVFDAPK